MADDPLPLPDGTTPALDALVASAVEQFHDVKKLSRWERLITNALQAGLTTAIAVVLKMAAKIGAFLGTSIADAENTEQTAFNELARVAILDMFGVDAPQLSATRGRGGNQAAADAVGGALMQAFSGQARGLPAPGETLEPSDAPARAFLSAMAQLALEGWLEGWIVEALSLGQMETFGELDDTISHVLGLGRASAAVHGPLVRHLIVEPLEWKVNKEHRPSLLSPSTVARQWQRGRWDWPDVLEELARQGWSDERIDAIINEQRKFLTVSDVALLSRRIDTATFDARQYLGDAGYDEQDAQAHLLAEATRRLDAQEQQLAAAYLSALVAGDISLEAFGSGIDGIKLAPEDAAHYHRLGELRRGLALTPLTDGDARDAVKRQIQTFAWYRAYLDRRGYDQDAIDTKELLLRADMDSAATAATLRTQQAADRIAAQLAATEARDARIAAKAVADAQPAYSEIRRAFVRGVVPLDRLQAAIGVAHPGIADADAAALVADAQLDRTTYETQLAAHAAALAGDTEKALPLATLEDSVLRGITTVDAYDRELARRKYSDDARRVLVALLRGRLDDQAAARQAKLTADARAQLRGVSLSDFERAVRLGLRTPQELEAFLVQLGTPDVERGLLLDLLQTDMAHDAAAAAKRAAADAAAATKAINLPLRRRAVVQGLRSIEQYSADLAAAGVSLDDRQLELDLVTVEAAAAAGARDRAAQLEAARGAIDAASPGPTLTLAQVEHAVKLGVLTPDDLRTYLSDRQYSDADISTLVSTVVATLPTLRQADQVQADATTALKARGLSLPELERAVARGLRTLDDYKAELTARGYGVDDVSLLAQLLAEKLAVDVDSLRKKVTTAIAGVTNGPTIAELETAITDQTVDAGTLETFLTSNGVARDVALLYLRLVPLYGAPGA